MRFPVALALAVASLQPGAVQAHELITTRLTWTEHISRIFFRRCVSCHREGASAPMPLMAYRQVRPWAKAIKYEVLSRRMPPWGAVKGYGAFRNDLSLSQEDIAKISSWVEGGAPQGNPVYLPAYPSKDSFAEEEPPLAEAMELRGRMTLDERTTALGVRPDEVPEGGSLEVRANLPDGRVEPLIWIRDYRPVWKRAYYFREPIVLPAGSQVFVFPAGEVSGFLLVGDPAAGDPSQSAGESSHSHDHER